MAVSHHPRRPRRPHHPRQVLSLTGVCPDCSEVLHVTGVVPDGVKLNEEGAPLCPSCGDVATFYENCPECSAEVRLEVSTS